MFSHINHLILLFEVGAIVGGLRGKLSVPQHYIAALEGGGNDLIELSAKFVNALAK